METLKKALIIALTGFVLMGGSVVAHPLFRHNHKGDSTKKKPEEIADMMTVKMKYALDLNTEQEAKVKAINLKYAKQQQDYLDANKKQIEEFEKGMNKIGEDKEKELATVLKPDQLTKYKTKREEMKKHHRHHENGKEGHGKWYHKR